MEIKIEFLGTGTSHGVPEIGCSCEVCRSQDPCDKRLRASIYIEVGAEKILVDTTPDLRTQALRSNITRVDRVIYTHLHADHLLGIDDLRKFNYLKKDVIKVYSFREFLEELKIRFPYINYTSEFKTGAVPQLDLHADTSFYVEGVEFKLLEVKHGKEKVAALKVGEKFAYVTDCSFIPENTWKELEGVNILVLGALRDTPHPKHFSWKQAYEVAKKLGVKRCYLTHISHRLSHQQMLREGEGWFISSYDTMKLVVEI